MRWLSKLLLLTLPFLVMAVTVSCDTEKKELVHIRLKPEIRYQTITGWEASDQSGEDVNPSGFSKYKETLFHLAVNDLGINRLRLHLRSAIETSPAMWQKYQNSQPEGRKELRYKTVNDNNDPFVINWQGYHFDEIDQKIEKITLPIKKLLEARGEELYLNLNYVNFNRSNSLHRESAEEYAEFIQVTFLHLHKKYGFVPDGVEIILEPDNSGFSGFQIGHAIVATARRLKRDGFSPDFIAPSTTSMARTIPWFNEMIKVPGVLQYLKEISYHRYYGVSQAALKSIADTAVRYKLNTSMLEHIGSDYRSLHDDLKTGRNSAWQQYTLAYPAESDNGGHYYRIDAGNDPEITMGSRTKFLRQYFKFIRQGAVRIEALSGDEDFNPLAFINKDGNYCVVVMTKRGGSISIEGLPPGKYGTKYTTAKEYDVDLPDLDIGKQDKLKARIPRKGVITIYNKSKQFS
jgi:hypothetical protein